MAKITISYGSANIRTTQAELDRKEGKSLTEIVSETNQPKTNVSRWLRRIEKECFEGIYDIKQSGRPAKLTKNQKAKLKKILSESPTKQDIPFTMWTSSLVQFIVHKLFNVLYKLRFPLVCSRVA